MAPQVDPALIEALGLDATTASVNAHGGAGFSSTFRLSGTVDGEKREFFVKTASGDDAAVMFEGEHASLNGIADAVPNFCPRSHAFGSMTQSAKHFLATDFLDLSSYSTSASGSGLSLAAKLARLHTTPAPTPPGRSSPAFGFPVTTCCGETPQDNDFRESWVDFYANARLRAILTRGQVSNGSDKELADVVEKTAAKVVPRLLGAVKDIKPVVVHGDLWSGNHGRGRIIGGKDSGSGGVEEVVYDSSAVYGHNEYELGIMNMFGGFGRSFWDEYHSLVPKADPAEEFDDRVKLYELYHHLNHWAIFGGGYRGGAMSIMKKLIAKYGS